MSKTTERGYIATDEKEFNGDNLNKVYKAAVDLLYLLNRGYKIKGASTFIGNHYLLSERQRLSLARGISKSEDIIRRNNKALSSYQLAVNEDSSDEEALNIINIIDNYLKAKEYFVKDELDKAKEHIESINVAYKDYSIKEDIDKLVKDIDKKVQALEAKKNEENVNNTILNGNTENSENKKQIYLVKLKNLDSEISEILSDDKYEAGTTIDIRAGLAIKYKKWDDMLNEIYGVLIEQLPEEEMYIVRAEQVNWISIRDAKANESGKQ